jgi:type 1 glutamine amidotransferase
MRSAFMGKTILFVLSFLFLLSNLGSASAQPKKVLMLDQWQQASHDPAQIAGDTLIMQLSRQMGFSVVISPRTGTATQLNDAFLQQVQLVIFNNCDYNPFTVDQKAAFIRYVDNGGAYIGWHAAAAIHGLWPEYTAYVGSDLINHPSGTPTARVYSEVKNKGNAFYDSLMKNVSESYSTADEWYNLVPDPSKDPSIIILNLVDETTYAHTPDNSMGPYHPESWCREKARVAGAQKSRMFYTALGHTPARYQDANFKTMIKNAIMWVAKPTTGIVPFAFYNKHSGTNRANSFTGYAEKDGGLFSLNGRHIGRSLSSQIIFRTKNDGLSTPVINFKK